MQNRPKNQPKFDPGGSGGHLGSPDPFWDRFGHQLGFHLGSILTPSGGHVGAMLAQKLILGGPGWLSKSTMKFDTFSNRFGTDFGSILGSEMEPESGPNHVPDYPKTLVDLERRCGARKMYTKVVTLYGRPD